MKKNRMRTFWLRTVVLVLFHVTVSAADGVSVPWPATGAAVSAAAEQERQTQAIASIAIGIVDADGQGWQSAVGYADASRTHAADAHTLYRIGPVAHALSKGLTLEGKAALAYAEMAPYDDVRRPAPLIDTGSAGDRSGYSNLDALVSLARSVLKGHSTFNGRARSFDGHGVLGYEVGGYGYAADFAVYPDDGFAVIVLIALNEAHPARRRLRDFAARLIFAARSGEPAPHYPAPSDAVPDVLARAIAGHYIHERGTIDVRVVEGRTYLEAPDVAAELRRSGSRWLLDDALTSREDVAVDPAAGSITLAGIRYQRAQQDKPAPPATELVQLIGDYGSQYDYLRIYERDGQPYVRIGSTDYERLERLGKDVYRLAGDPDRQLQFLRGRAGAPTGIRFDNIVWPRHDFGAEAQAHIHALVRHVPGLRDNAWKATPPPAQPLLRAPDLTEVVRIAPDIRLDIRYATRNNIMGIAVYDEPRAFLQRPAAEALVRAHERLGREHGFGILIHDTYRPWAVTKMFWDATPPSAHDFVADPSKGSKHNRGCAADITLYDRASGATLEMTGRYDEISARSNPIYVGGSSLQRWRRDVLKDAVEAEGFAIYRYEWWHFDHHLWRQYPVMNIRFGDVPASVPGTQ